MNKIIGVSRRKIVAGLTAAALAVGGSVVSLGVTAPAANALNVPCQVNFVIEQDLTYSLSAQNVLDTKEQLKSTVASFEGLGIPVKAGISSFGLTAPIVSAPPRLNLDINNPLTNQRMQDAIEAWERDGSASSSTNWEAGLEDAFDNAKAQGAKQIIFVTDGVPNAYVSDAGNNIRVSDTYSKLAAENAKVSADKIRAAGITLTVAFVRSNHPGLHGLDDPLEPTPVATVTQAMSYIQPGWTITKAVSIPQLAIQVRDKAMGTCISSMTLAKTHVDSDVVDKNGNGITDSGDTVAFSFKVVNTGTAPLNNLVITDPKLAAAGVTLANGGKIRSIPVNGSATLRSNPYTLTLADTDAGKFINVATVTGVSPNKTVTTNGTDTVPTDQAPKVSLAKFHAAADVVDVNDNGKTDAGDTAAFTFTATNTGNVTLDNIFVTDQKLEDAGVSLLNSGQIKPLGPGEQGTVKSNPYTITQADVEAGRFDNSATISADSPLGVQVTATDTDRLVPDQAVAMTLAVTHPAADIVDKNGNGKTDAGDTVAFTYTATNTGTVVLSGVTVTDSKLAALGITLANAGKLSNLNPGAKGSIKSSPYTIKQADVEAGAFTTTGTVVGTSVKGNATSSDTDTVPMDQYPEVDLLKSHSSTDIVDKNGNALLDAGDTLVFTYEATNTGTVALTNVTVSDAILAAAGVALVNDGKLGSLALGAKATVKSLPYTLRQADVEAGEFTTTGSVVGTSVKGTATATSESSVVIDQKGRVALAKSHAAADVVDVNGDSRTDPGDTVVFTYKATNTGTVTLTNVTVSDAILAAAGVKLVNDGKLGTLAPGASATIKSQLYTLKKADADAGKFTSTGSVVGVSINGTVTATSTSSLTVLQLPKFSVVFDSNAQMGTITGTMPSIVVEYGCATCMLPANGFTKSTGAPELIDHDIETADVKSTFLGWSLDKASRTGDIADRSAAGNLSRTNGATVRLYAIWDDAPRFIITSYPDRFFTLKQAASGAITEAALLSTVKATDRETNPLLSKTGAQVLSSGTDVGVTVFDYDPVDFTSLTDSGVVTATYKVKDELGHVAFLRIRVTVSDDAPLAPDAATYLRGISPKYSTKPSGDGGLPADSLWKTDPTRKAALDRALKGTPLTQTRYCLDTDALADMREQLSDPTMGMGNSKTENGLAQSVGVLRTSGTCA